MQRGIIEKNRPLTSIQTAWKENAQDLVVMVDTGFTGDLKLSSATAEELGLEITHTEVVRLGDDSIVEMSSATASVVVDDGQEIVTVLISPGEPVIGAGLLKKCECVLKADFRVDNFTIQRCPAA